MEWSPSANCRKPEGPLTLVLKQVSANCLIGTHGNTFFKVTPLQRRDDVDDFELETLNAVRFEKTIDPEHQYTIPLCGYSWGACSLVPNTADTIQLSMPGQRFQDIVIMMPSIDKVDLSDYPLLRMREEMTPEHTFFGAQFKAGAVNKAANQIRGFVEWYITMSERFVISHNDLHACNVIYDRKRDRLVLIDFGRMTMGADFQDGADLDRICNFSGRKFAYEELVGRLQERFDIVTSPSRNRAWIGDIMRLTTNLFLDDIAPRMGTTLRLPGAIIYPTKDVTTVVLAHAESPKALAMQILHDLANGTDEWERWMSLGALAVLGLSTVSIGCMRLKKLLGLGSSETRGYRERVVEAAIRGRVPVPILEVILRAFQRENPDTYTLSSDDVATMSFSHIHQLFTDEDVAAITTVKNGIMTLWDSIAGGGGDSDLDDDTGLLGELFPTSLHDAYAMRPERPDLSKWDNVTIDDVCAAAEARLTDQGSSRTLLDPYAEGSRALWHPPPMVEVAGGSPESDQPLMGGGMVDGSATRTLACVMAAVTMVIATLPR